MLKLQKVRELAGKANGLARTTTKAIWRSVRKIAATIRKTASNMTIRPSLLDVRLVAMILALLPPVVLGTVLIQVFGWWGLMPLIFLIAIDARMVWREWFRELEPTPPNKHLVMIFGSYQKTGEYSFLLLKGGLQFLPFYGRIVETKLVPVSELIELEFEVPDVRTSTDNVISKVNVSLRLHISENHIYNLIRIYGEIAGSKLDEAVIKERLQDLLDEVVKQAVREIAAHDTIPPNDWKSLKSAGQNLVDWIIVKIRDGKGLAEMTKDQFQEEVLKVIEAGLTEPISPGITVGRYGIEIEGGAISDVKTDDPVVTSSEKMAVLQAELSAIKARTALNAERVKIYVAAGTSSHDAVVKVNAEDGGNSIMIAGEGALPILPLPTPGTGGKK